MTRIRMQFAVLVLILTLCACTQSVQSTPTVTVEIVPTGMATQEMIVPETPAATEALEIAPGVDQRSQVDLAARYNDIEKSLSVNEKITYVNQTGTLLNEIVMAVDMNRYFNGFSLESLAINGTDALSAVALDGIKLELPLEKPLQVGEQVSVELSYTAVLPPIPEPVDGAKPQVCGYTERQVNLVDWYPYIVPYQAENGWVLHEPTYYGEYLVYEMADYHVSLEIQNAARPMVVAASALDATDGQDASNHEYSLLNGRNFVLSMSPDYQVKTADVNGVTILGYSFPIDSTAADAAFANTVEAYRLYSELFGALDQPSLSLVEADFLDGMEFQGLYFLSKGFYNLYDGTPQGYLTTIAVHETAHQWWYASVSNDQSLHPWLDEAFCTYSERLYYERYHPELVDWWWAYRVTFYQPTGKIDKPVAYYAGFTPYRNAVYLRGAQFLEAVRTSIGNEPFLALLKGYAQENAGKIVLPDELLERMRAVGGEQLNAVFQEYLSQ